MNQSHKGKKVGINTQNRIIIACLVLAITGIVTSAPAVSATSMSTTGSEESSTSASQTGESQQQEDGGAAQDQGTAEDGTTDLPPSPSEPGPTGPTGVSNVTTDLPPSPSEPGPTGPTGVSNASGVAVGPNATTNTQQAVSNILNDIRATETNQTEIAQVEAVLPAVVNALTQVGGPASSDIQIKWECTTTYDENGKKVSRTCTLTLGS